MASDFLKGKAKASRYNVNKNYGPDAYGGSNAKEKSLEIVRSGVKRDEEEKKAKSQHEALLNEVITKGKTQKKNEERMNAQNDPLVKAGILPDPTTGRFTPSLELGRQRAQEKRDNDIYRRMLASAGTGEVAPFTPSQQREIYRERDKKRQENIDRFENTRGARRLAADEAADDLRRAAAMSGTGYQYDYNPQYGTGAQAREEAWQRRVDEYNEGQAEKLSRLSSVNESGDFARLSKGFDASSLRGAGSHAVKYALEPEYRAELDEYNKRQGLLETTDEPLKYLSDKERDIVRYYAAKGELENANEYIDVLRPELNRRMQTGRSAEMRQMAERDPAAGALYNITAAKEAGAALIPTAAAAFNESILGRYTPIDTNSRAYRAAHDVRDTAEGVGNAAYKAAGGGTMGEAARFLAETGLSIGQFASMIPMGQTAPLAFMGAQAAGSTALDTLEGGGSASEALLLSVGAGVIETLTEKIGIDNLFRVAKSGKRGLRGFLQNTLSQMGAEGSEELISEVSNNIADAVILGEKGEFERLVETIASERGITRTEAEKEALFSLYVVNPARAFLGGALSGAVMGAGGGAANAAYNRATDAVYSQRARDVYDGLATEMENAGITPAQIIEAAKESGVPAAERMARDIEARYTQGGEEMSREEMAKLHLLAGEFVTQEQTRDFEERTRQEEAAANTQQEGGDALRMRSEEEVREGEQSQNEARETAEQRAAREYGAALVDSGLVEFARQAKTMAENGQNVSRLNYEISDVGSREAQDVGRIVGFDISGYTHNIKGNAIAHIENRHGKNGQQDRSMADVSDIGKIQYVLDNYDEVEALIDKQGQPVESFEYKNSDGTPSKTVRYIKRINGVYYLVEAVPDSERKRLQVISAYKSRNKNDDVSPVADNASPDEAFPSPTSQNEPAPTSSDNMISNPTEEVNGENAPQEGETARKGSDAAAEETASAEEERRAQGENAPDTQTQEAAAEAREKISRILSRSVKAGYTGTPAGAAALNREQRRFFDKLGRLLGVEIQIVESIPTPDGGGANGLYKNGHVLIAADSDNPFNVVLTHEITHHFERTAPKMYKQYMEAALDFYRSGEQDIVKEYREAFGLSLSEARHEAAADFAEQFLSERRAVEKLIAERRGVAQALYNAMNRVFGRIRGITGSEAGQYVRQMDSAARLWKECFREARENRGANVDGAEQYSRKGDGDYSSIKEQIIKNLPALQDMETLMEINSAGWNGRSKPQIRRTLEEKFKRIGYRVDRQNFGLIEFGPEDLNTSLNYISLDAEIAAYEALPSLLKRGKILPESHENHKERGHQTITIAGKVTINSEPAIVAAVVKRTKGNRYKVHRVTNMLGEKFNMPKINEADPTTGNMTGENTGEGKPIGSASDKSIPQTGENNKPQFSMKKSPEFTKTLMAIHNLNAVKLNKALDLGGFPMPSIAVTRRDIPHTAFGDISLVMKREAIDPKASRRNTVYSADAWTPTFPQVEYEADEKAARRLSGKYYKLNREHGGEAIRALYPWGNYPEDELNRVGGEQAAIEKYRDDTDMMRVYLLDSGLDVPDTVMDEKVSRLDDDTISFYDYLIGELGEEVFKDFAPKRGENPMQTRRDWWAANGEAFDAAYRGYLVERLGFSTEEADNVIGNENMASQTTKAIKIRNYINNGAETRTREPNIEATENAIRRAVDRAEYNKWLDGLFGGLEKSSGIYNNKERYAASGNLRSFRATHLPVTLDNIVTAMRTQNGGNTQNTAGFYGVKTLRASLAERFKSVEDMHRLERRLNHLSEEEAKEIHDALNSRLSDVISTVVDKSEMREDNSIIAFDRVGGVLTEIAESGKYSITDIRKTLEGYRYNVSLEDAKAIKELLFDVSEMPVNMFEAKPERAVGFDEVLAAVVPSDIDAELKSRMEGAGMRVVEYNAGDEQDRLRAVNSIEGAQFSRRRADSRVIKETTLKAAENIAKKEQTATEARGGKAKENPVRRMAASSSAGAVSWNARRTTGKTAKAKPISELISDMRGTFGINITVGHIRGRNTKGQYDARNKGIRTKMANDLPTAAHELGHALEDKYDILNGISERIKKELHGALGELKEAYDAKLWDSEGFAEYLRQYLQNSEEAQAEYPETTNRLMNALPAKELMQLLELADEVNAYYALTAETAEKAIRFAGEKTIKERVQSASRGAVGDFIREKMFSVYQAWVDSNTAIRRFDRETGANTYKLATNAAYSDAMAGQIITGELTDANGQYVGPGLRAALKGIDLNNREQYRLFGEYLIVKHGPERLAEGMRVFADERHNTVEFMDRRAAVLEAEHPEFKEAAERIYKFNRDFMKTWGVSTGLVSRETADEWAKRWRYYVPFQRKMDDGRGAGAARRGFANQDNTIKRARGSGRDIIHPVDGIIGNIVKMVNAGVRNNVMRAITDAAEELRADAAFLEKVPTPMRANTFDMTGVKDKLSEWLAQSGLDSDSLDAARGTVNMLDDLLLQFGRGKAFGDVVTVMKEGKPEFWKINDPDLLGAVTSLSPKTQSGILEAYGTISKFMTSNITGMNIIWSVFSNAPRDLATMFTYSKTKNPVKLGVGMGRAYINKYNLVRGKQDKLDPLYREFLAMGGGQNGVYSADRDLARKARRELAEKKKKTEYMNPLDWIEWASNAVESGPRYATYKLMRERGMGPQEAFYEAMDITTNFRRGGSMSRQLNKVVPFFNAGMQGLDKFARWIRAEEAPKAQRAAAVKRRSLAFIAASAAIAAIFYAINNGDDDREKAYQQLSNFTKNNFFCIPLGDGRFFAVPKPREIAVLSSFFETALEYGVGGNKHAFDEFYDYFTDQCMPTFVSDLAKVPTDGAGAVMNVVGDLGVIGVLGYMGANRDFLGRPIVSQAMQKLESRDQYNARTSAIAKAIGQAFGTSPVMVDYFFQNTLGGFWKVQRAVFPVGGENRDLTLGIKNSYVKDSMYSTDLVNWMYDKAEASERAKNSAPGDVDKAITAKMDDNLKAFYSKYYALAKNTDDSKDTDKSQESRNARQTMLDMINEYRKASDSGALTSVQKTVYDICREAGDVSLLPGVMSQTVKDADGNEYALTDAQYLDYQVDYLRRYWEMCEDTLGGDATAEKKAVLLAQAKTVAKEYATSNILSTVGGGDTLFARKYAGLDEGTVSQYKAALIEADKRGDKNGSAGQDEATAAIKSMTGLTNDQKAQLWQSTNTSWTGKENPYGPKAALTEAQYSAYRSVASGVEQSSVYRNATDKERKAYTDALYDVVVESKKGKEIKEKIAASGVSDNAYYELLIAQKVADRTAGDDNGRVNKEEYIAALGMVNMTNAQRAALFDAKYKEGNPYR